MQQLMDLSTVASTHPSLPEDLIILDNLIETIEERFNTYDDMVLIEGEEGAGKTTLIKQFSDKYYNNAISIFIKSTSRFAYDPQVILADLYNQVHWIVHKREAKEFEKVNDAQMNLLFYKFTRHIRNKDGYFYLIIDGLEDIPSSENYILEIIMGFLPFGLSSGKVKFLLTSNSQGRIQEFLINKSIGFSPFFIPGFSKEQAIKFFKEVEINPNQIDEIRKICKGRPGDLYTVKRTIETGTHVEDLLVEIHDKFPNLFEYEWNKLEKDDKIIDLLSVLAHERNTNKLTFLSQLLNISEREIRELCLNISFLDLDSDTNEVSFFSESYRHFIASKLENKKVNVKNLIMKHLLSDRKDENILMLPTFLNEAGELDELINVLSPEHFSKLLSKTQSLGELSRMAQMGTSAALQRKRDEELFRFGIQSSLIMENYTSKILKSEVKALMSLNEYDRAMALTQSNSLIEDRLHMLAIIARHKKEQGLTPDLEVTENINRLYSSIDFNSLGKAQKIAEELIYTNPEMAIELIEKSTGNEQGENAFDFALAKLSIATMNGTSNNADLETFQSLNSKFKNPKMKSLFHEFSTFIRNNAPKDVLLQVKKYESSSDQIYILSNWCAVTKTTEGVEEVIEYALKLAVNTAEYAPNAGIYRKLSTQIPYIMLNEKLKQLVNLFESQMQNIERIGPTEDYILIQLNLARALCQYDYDLYSEKLVNLYLYINDLEDTSIRTEGNANLYIALKETDLKLRLEEQHGLHQLVYDDLTQCINELLTGAANHYEGFKGTINALSKRSPDMTLDLIEKLNTSFARETSYLEFVTSYTDQIIDDYGISLIKEVIDKISDIDIFSKAILTVIESLYFSEDEHDAEYINKFVKIFNKIREVPEPEEKCKGICLMYSLIRDIDSLETFRDSLLSELRNTWNAIDIGWRKVDIGFIIINTLSEDSIDYVREFLQEVEEFRNDLNFYDPNISWSFIHVLSLSIRSFNGLLSNDIDNEKDLDRISYLIETVPSKGEQAILWGELALRFFINGKDNVGKRLVLDKIKPCITNISDLDFRYKIHVLTKVAPALFTAHQRTCFELLDVIPERERDMAHFNIAQFIFTKVSPSEPYDETGKNYEINYEDVVDICDLIERVDIDNLTYSIISDICNSIDQSRRFTVQHKLDVAKRLEELIAKKLPNKKHIKHDGYKIISMSEVLKIRNSKNQEWLSLIKAAKEISNHSDRAFVLTHVASNFPRAKHSKVEEIIKEVEELINTLPTIEDKVTQYEAMATKLVKYDQVKSKGFIKKAMDLSLSKDEDGKVSSIQKRLIDFAHKIDPEFAESLVSINDDDPARKKIRYELEEELQTLELKKNMINNNQKSIVKSTTSETYVKASVKLLGGLNSGRVGTLHVEELREYIDISSKLPLSEAYYIYSWVLENSNIRFKNDASRASQFIRPIFESILLGAEFSVQISGNNKIQINKVNSMGSNNSILVKSGEREKALEYLKIWFESNAQKYLKICDPYFSLEDLSIVQLFREIKPEIKFEVLTSVKNQKQEEIKGNYEEEFMNFWRLKISDQDPPEVDICIVGKKSDGELPIHDRWIFTKESGLRLGTSYKSLGIKKDSEISTLDATDKELLEEEVNKYLNRSLREYDGERLVYNSFPL